MEEKLNLALAVYECCRLPAVADYPFCPEHGGDPVQDTGEGRELARERWAQSQARIIRRAHCPFCNRLFKHGVCYCGGKGEKSKTFWRWLWSGWDVTSGNNTRSKKGD